MKKMKTMEVSLQRSQLSPSLVKCLLAHMSSTPIRLRQVCEGRRMEW